MNPTPDDLPYAPLVMEGGEPIGVRCPVCGEVLSVTDPRTAGRIYSDHYEDNHIR